MSDVRGSQSRAIVTMLAVVAAAGAAIGACQSYQRANGEGCLKNADCLTNYCQAQICASPPVTLLGSAYEEAGPSEDSGPEAGDAGDASSDDAPADTATGG